MRGIIRPRVHLSVDDELVLTDPEQAPALVRCVQEIVTNTVRHADADNLWIVIGRDTAGVTVRCRDDGRGVVAVRPGNGLTGVRQRFEQIGGRLSYDTAPGAGFRLARHLPHVMIKVCVADDQTLVRQGIRSLLELSDGIEVVAEARDRVEALDACPPSTSTSSCSTCACPAWTASASRMPCPHATLPRCSS